MGHSLNFPLDILILNQSEPNQFYLVLNRCFSSKRKIRLILKRKRPKGNYTILILKTIIDFDISKRLISLTITLKNVNWYRSHLDYLWNLWKEQSIIWLFFKNCVKGADSFWNISYISLVFILNKHFYRNFFKNLTTHHSNFKISKTCRTQSKRNTLHHCI